MNRQPDSLEKHMNISRRALVRAGAATAVAAASGSTLASPVKAASPSSASTPGTPSLRELHAKVRAGMTKYAIPGAAIGVWTRGRPHLQGFGVTNVDHPVPVDADTVFRIGSVTKTFTGTALMRLVEQGAIHLDHPVRTYLPEFRTAEPAVGAGTSVRQLLNHSAGWLGDYLYDTGRGDDALVRYLAGMARVPQFTTPGHTFAYNNAAIAVAGRLIEVATGKPYESALRDLLIDPLDLGHSRFFADEIIGLNVAAGHDVVAGKPVVDPSFFSFPRSIQAAGGLISSARDLLRYARFHLGHDGLPGHPPLSRRSLTAMRSGPGPGGTFAVELDGVGVTWMLRPSAEGVRIVQHSGDWPGYHTGFLMVPDRDFAVVMLTNSEGGPDLLAELFCDDWALRHFAGISNLPAVPQALPANALAEYEGLYTQQQIGMDGSLTARQVELSADRGQIVMRRNGEVSWRLAFYRPDYVLVLNPEGKPDHSRADFVRNKSGEVAWLRIGGRLLRRGQR